MMNKNLANSKINNGIVFNMSDFEWLIIYLLFIFSFINTITLLITLILLLSFLMQKEIGAIKILNLITLRSIINPGIAVSINSFQNLKWMIIFLCSLYLMLGYKQIDNNKKMSVNKILLAVLLFAMYTVISSFLFSTLPIVAIFKLLSYIIVFLGVMIGVAITNEKYNWIEWMYKMMMFLFISSIPFIVLSVGYFKNGNAFQGTTNQPNMFGILSALFVALIIVRVQLGNFNGKIKPFILLSSLIYMIILSESRTGFITTVILIMLFFILTYINKIKKIMFLNFFGVIIIIYTLLDGQLIRFIKQFLYKGHEEILFSRIDQVDGLVSNFLRNPWFGSGFAVPVTSYRVFDFSFDFIVEPGNLIFAVLSYGGIFGFILFISYLVKIFMFNVNDFKTMGFLLIASILINMGEMVFFSSNNIGIWVYMWISIYMFYNKEERTNAKK